MNKLAYVDGVVRRHMQPSRASVISKAVAEWRVDADLAGAPVAGHVDYVLSEAGHPRLSASERADVRNQCGQAAVVAADKPVARPKHRPWMYTVTDGTCDNNHAAELIARKQQWIREMGDCVVPPPSPKPTGKSGARVEDRV